MLFLTFLFVSFFDTAGTLVAVSQQAGLMKDNVLPGAGKGLLADSLSIVLVQFSVLLLQHLMLNQLQVLRLVLVVDLQQLLQVYVLF